jgi:Methyltransferase domain
LDVELSKIDMLIALHACDIATDMAIQKGILSSAQVILLSPCCHKQIRKEIKIKNDITKFGIYEERMAEMITDTIRSLILNHFGYKTNIIEYISSEHTSKNTMIIAEYNGVSDKDALEKIGKIKAEYGIGQHYLEQLLFT